MAAAEGFAGDGVGQMDRKTWLIADTSSNLKQTAERGLVFVGMGRNIDQNIVPTVMSGLFCCKNAQNL